MPRIRKPLDERGMTLIELAVVVIVLGTLMSIAVAAMFRARMSAREGAALAGLRAISRAQFQYQASCGNGLYARSLTVLGTKPAQETESFLPGDMGMADAPSRGGYTFTVTAGEASTVGPNDCNGTATITRYYASASPTEFGNGGSRSFATNQAGSLWENSEPTAPTEPFGPPDMLVR